MIWNQYYPNATPALAPRTLLSLADRTRISNERGAEIGKMRWLRFPPAHETEMPALSDGTPAGLRVGSGRKRQTAQAMRKTEAAPRTVLLT